MARRILRGEQWAQRLQHLLADVDKVYHWMDDNSHVLKSDAFSKVGLITIDQQLCYLKFYRCKSPLQLALFHLGIGRGVTSFDTAIKLNRANIAVPEPRACLLVPRGMVLLTEGVERGRDLKSLWQAKPDDGQLRQLMAASGRALAELHMAGFSHGDCKWSNFLFCREKLYFIDLEAVQEGPPGHPRRARDLARFTLNAEDMGLEPAIYEVFLSTYARGVGRDREALVAEILGPLGTLRRKHLSKYGTRGARLL